MTSFSKILDLCSVFNETLPGVVFIGGVAVYLHAMHADSPIISPESSHDADFMISFAGYGDLKDAEEITYNARLGKHQAVVWGVELDIYVERLNRLVVPYDEVAAYAEDIGQIRLACLEHLLVLKLEAYDSRWHSSKGEKDRMDIVKIGLLLGKDSRLGLIQPYMRDGLARRLGDIARSSVFHELCKRNAHEAKRVRSMFEKFAANVIRG
jgi:hypothetical protein